MINIIHNEVRLNDRRQITAITVKLKYFKETDATSLHDHALVATISAAFYRTTLLTDSGKSLSTELNPNRNDIVNLTVYLKKDNSLTHIDVGNFLTAFQKALDEISAQF